MDPRKNLRIVSPAGRSREASDEEPIVLILLGATGCNENMQQVAHQQFRTFFQTIRDYDIQEEIVYLALCDVAGTINVSARIELALLLRRNRKSYQLRLIGSQTYLHQTLADIARSMAQFSCRDIAIIEFCRSPSS